MTSQSIHTYFKRLGRKGGKARAHQSSPAALLSQARKAIVSRWMHKRFGTNNFKALALPGWEIVDSGLHDLIHGNFSSLYALAVAEFRPKLRFLGVPVPDVNQISNARALLYQTMEAKEGDMAYVRFCSLLERMDSFCDALASVISIPKHKAHQNRRWYV